MNSDQEKLIEEFTSVGSIMSLMKTPNTACTRTPEERRGWRGGSLRVFRQFAWLDVGSDKMALSRPAHQRVTQAVRRQW
jgi:hypothetical protein